MEFNPREHGMEHLEFFGHLIIINFPWLGLALAVLAVRGVYELCRSWSYPCKVSDT